MFILVHTVKHYLFELSDLFERNDFKMKSMPKFIATVVVFVIAILVCISLIFAAIALANARIYHNDVIADLEASYFDDTVMSNRIQAAEEKGYALSITKEQNMSSTEHYKVVLCYDLILPLFGKVHTGELVGYAYYGGIIEGNLGTADHYFEIDSNGVLGIKAAYRWATGLEDYASDNGKDAAGSKNDLLPSEITIPTYFDGYEVKALRDYMLANNSNLTRLSFEEGVEKIGDSAFFNCTNLDGSVAMPDSAETLGVSAFEGCLKLDAVNFKTTSSLKTVNDYAFKNCVEFTNVALPDSMTKNGFGAYQGCTNMTSYKAPFVGASPTASKKDGGYIGHIFGGEDYKSNSTTTPSKLSTVNITSYVTMYACYEMSQLKNLTLGDKITYFDAYPFAYCDGLTSVIIPKNVKETDSAAFYYCTNLTKVTFASGSNLTTLGASNFAHCEKLNTINLPNTIKSIGSYAFQYCDALTFQSNTTGKIPSSVTTIGNSAYADCNSTSFTQLVIPASVTSIDFSIVNESKYVKKISVASENTAYCTGVNGELLTYDKTVLVQYPYAAPTSYTVPDSVTTIFRSAFEDCDKLKTLKFGTESKLTTIERSAFGHCSDIEGIVTLPASVTTIGDYAFYHAGSWSTFNIGAKVSNIGTYAFYDAGASASKTYLLMTTAPTIGDNAFFTNTISNGTITKNYLYVKNDVVKNALINNTHYRDTYTIVEISS